MTDEQQQGSRVRLFVALELPDALRSGIGEWGAEALADPALRPLPAPSLHLTLVFLGQRPEAEVESIGAAVRALRSPAPDLRLGDPVARPERGRPRLYALPVESDGVVGLQSELVSELSRANLHRPEERPFWPHLTIARVRSEEGRRKRPRTVESPPGSLTQGLLQPARAVRVSLYLSKLKPQGAEYTPLAHTDLR